MEFVINSGTMSCCGKSRPECKCALNQDSSLSPAHLASREAVYSTILALPNPNDASHTDDHSTALKHAERALKHAESGNGERAARAHVRAAQVHEALAIKSAKEGDHKAARGHDSAAFAHRQAASLHSPNKGDDTVNRLIHNVPPIDDDILLLPTINDLDPYTSGTGGDMGRERAARRREEAAWQRDQEEEDHAQHADDEAIRRLDEEAQRQVDENYRRLGIEVRSPADGARVNDDLLRRLGLNAATDDTPLPLPPTLAEMTANERPGRRERRGFGTRRRDRGTGPVTNADSLGDQSHPML